MPLLSPDLYREFGIPYAKRLSDAFGGLLIHCCGDWGRHAESLAASGIAIRGVEYHHPFTTIEELEPLAEGAVFVPYLSLEKQDDFASQAEYYEHLLNHTPDSYRFWFAFPDESEEATAFATAHGF